MRCHTLRLDSYLFRLFNSIVNQKKLAKLKGKQLGRINNE